MKSQSEGIAFIVTDTGVFRKKWLNSLSLLLLTQQTTSSPPTISYCSLNHDLPYHRDK